jgi:hypothetical protein
MGTIYWSYVYPWCYIHWVETNGSLAETNAAGSSQTLSRGWME